MIDWFALFSSDLSENFRSFRRPSTVPLDSNIQYITVLNY